MIQKVIQEAIRRCSKRPTANRVDPAEMATYERLFQGQMSIYRSHWRDDPLFDRSNADAALADLPCPEIDHACLLRLASYAVEANFNQRRYESVARDFDVGQRLESLLGAAGAGGDKLADASVGLHVTGPGGGVWRLLLRGGRWSAPRPRQARRGVPHQRPDICLSCPRPGDRSPVDRSRTDCY